MKEAVNRKNLSAQQNLSLDDRTKVHEDALLKKLQNEQVRQTLAKVHQESQAEPNREYYEDQLLKKLMQNMSSPTGNVDFSRPNGEMLMITSAVPLTEEEKEAIVRKFMAKTQKSLRRITTVVDPALITGIRLQSESFYYEVSGQKTLRELRKHLDKNWHY